PVRSGPTRSGTRREATAPPTRRPGSPASPKARSRLRPADDLVHASFRLSYVGSQKLVRRHQRPPSVHRQYAGREGPYTISGGSRQALNGKGTPSRRGAGVPQAGKIGTEEVENARKSGMCPGHRSFQSPARPARARPPAVRKPSPRARPSLGRVAPVVFRARLGTRGRKLFSLGRGLLTHANEPAGDIQVKPDDA